MPEDDDRTTLPRDWRHWAKAPAGERLYAIGDMHGRLDLVDRMHELIRADAAGRAAAHVTVVYLGDYVDRGPASKHLVDRLLQAPLGPFETVYLKGNHEDLMLEFLDRGTQGRVWLINGGDATFASYGVTPPSIHDDESYGPARRALIDAMPAGHRAFFEGLRVIYRAGDYAFVHAGVRPDVALEAQNERDLIWIREQFLNSDADFGACVVHGHTIAPEPVRRHNRIGLDTGAYGTGRLSCAVLEGDSVRILQT